MAKSTSVLLTYLGSGRKVSHKMVKRRKQLKDQHRVLLVSPPIYDIRLHWPKWQVPSRLYTIGSYLTSIGSDVKFLDGLEPGRQRITRRQVDSVIADGIAIQKWRFGPVRKELSAKIALLKEGGWQPDWIIIEGFTTFWWQGVIEASKTLREAFPGASQFVTGAYAELAAQHMAQHCDAKPFCLGDLDSEILIPDISFVESPPPSLFFRLPRKPSCVPELIEDLFAARLRGVGQFSLITADLLSELASLDAFVAELERTKRKFSFDILGSLSPQEIIKCPDAAGLLKRAGMKHLCFGDDREDLDAGEGYVDACSEAVTHFHRAGYRPRTDAVSASLSLGRHGEDIAERTRCATLLNHTVGSVIFWPYQPTPAEMEDDRLEMHNGKLFPMRHANGLTYKDYAELIALNAVLNSRYRDCSFDFMGQGLIAGLLASSIAREGWNPDPAVKGPLTLPMRVVQS